jgi:hypothetical protein
MAGTTGGWTAVDEPTQGWTPVDEEDQLTKKTNEVAKSAGAQFNAPSVGKPSTPTTKPSMSNQEGDNLNIAAWQHRPNPKLGEFPDYATGGEMAPVNVGLGVSGVSSAVRGIRAAPSIGQGAYQHVVSPLLKAYAGSEVGRVAGKGIDAVFHTKHGEQVGQTAGALAGPFVSGKSFARLPMGAGRLVASNEEYAAALAERKLAQRNADLAVGLRTSKPVDEVASAVRNRTANWLPTKLPPPEVTPMTESPYYNDYAAAKSNAREEAANNAMNRPGWTAPLPARVGGGTGIEGAGSGGGRNGVGLFPEPREPLPQDRPGAMWSVKRQSTLPAAALRGAPGAGDVLRNLGKPVLFEPREGTGYGGPRQEYSSVGPEPQPPTGEIPAGNQTPFENKNSPASSKNDIINQGENMKKPQKIDEGKKKISTVPGDKYPPPDEEEQFARKRADEWLAKHKPTKEQIAKATKLVVDRGDMTEDDPHFKAYLADKLSDIMPETVEEIQEAVKNLTAKGLTPSSPKWKMEYNDEISYMRQKEFMDPDERALHEMDKQETESLGKAIKNSLLASDDVKSPVDRRTTPRATALNSSPVDPIREARVNDLREIVRDSTVPERDRSIAQAQLNDLEANPGERNELGDNPAKLKKAKQTMSREEAEASSKKRTEGRTKRFKDTKIPKKHSTTLADSENMNDPDTRFTAAKHEAGHAVIGELLRPGSVENSSLGERGGETNITPPAGKTNVGQLNRDELHDMLTASFAGGMAEDGGTTVTHASGDRKVRNQLTGSQASTPAQNASRFAFGRTFNDPMLQAPNAQAAARAKVTALLADPKTHDLINSVAEKLSLGGKLSGDEIRQILKLKGKK